jgi:hypothetical protein
MTLKLRKKKIITIETKTLIKREIREKKRTHRESLMKTKVEIKTKTEIGIEIEKGIKKEIDVMSMRELTDRIEIEKVLIETESHPMMTTEINEEEIEIAKGDVPEKKKTEIRGKGVEIRIGISMSPIIPETISMITTEGSKKWTLDSLTLPSRTPTLYTILLKKKISILMKETSRKCCKLWNIECLPIARMPCLRLRREL